MTELGISSSVSDLQQKKASNTMLTESGISICVKKLQPLKASLRMPVADSGIPTRVSEIPTQCWSQSSGFLPLSGSVSLERSYIRCWSLSWEFQLLPKLRSLQMQRTFLSSPLGVMTTSFFCAIAVCYFERRICIHVSPRMSNMPCPKRAPPKKQIILKIS